MRADGWPPRLGAIVERGGTTFRAWTTRARRVAVRILDGQQRPTCVQELQPRGGGIFETHVPSLGAGTLYKFLLDDREVPDPYARYLPFGVHGAAEVIAPAHASALRPAPMLERLCTYELHVGTFTPEGTYEAARAKLNHIAELGIGAVELMPLSAFPGERGWGYDGVAHYAPHASYGRPEDLRRFLGDAHELGLFVLLDVVFNHFGPNGNYLPSFSPEYFTRAFTTPWGDALDFAEPHMRAYVLGAAHMWLEEYGFDGLRLDATHAIFDGSKPHVLRELADLAASLDPPRLLVAEDDRNESSLVTELGLDAVWADDFHHHLWVLMTGEQDGYYAAYEPAAAALAHAIERGWSYEGQHYSPWGRPRGTRADAFRPEQFVYCIENHDQAGNRAFGERLSQKVSPGAFCAASALLFFLPMSPLVFMGQEWGASTPFLYFTQHDAELGALVSKGRREEFKSFRAFSDPDARARIPDPQAPATFETSKLRWQERLGPPHARVFAMVRKLLSLRREDPVLRERCERKDLRARAEADVIVVERSGGGGRRVLLANLTPRPVGIAWQSFGESIFATEDMAAGSLPPWCATILKA
ncbi:MAG TPA: malto-oligosyltrehalose trehalohydrolase [Polyangiaceae bacterium]|nr:malto-oligosyltrehalose trehalohydrolase [Polyangiaceae bacterium]